jgi:hypothetical protein
VHVVDEATPAVYLDDRDPLPILRLQPGIAVDRHLAQLEAELLVRGGENAPSRLAKAAARRGVEDDLGYG